MTCAQATQSIGLMQWPSRHAVADPSDADQAHSAEVKQTTLHPRFALCSTEGDVSALCRPLLYQCASFLFASDRKADCLFTLHLPVLHLLSRRYTR